MENGCICTTGGASVRALGAAALLCTALTGTVMANDDPACGPPNANDCFAANATPGCSDLDCCKTICSCDAFCCATAWDTYCAGTGFAGSGCGAQLLCAQPAAACCVSGECQTLDSLACADAGGIYQGQGSDCASIVCGQPPENDNCADSILLSCDDSVTVDNTFATTEPDEVFFPLSCFFGGPDIVAGSVWYHIVGTGDTIQIDTCSSVAPADDTLIAVYDPSGILGCYNFAEIACSEDVPGCGPIGLNSRVCFPTELGFEYHVLVGSFSDADRGVITINVTCPCPEGACCFIGDGSCIDTNQTDCEAQGGDYQGDGTLCKTTECPLICGPSNPNDCFSGNATPGCSDAECCETICACDPFCCETAWDVFCANDGFPAGSGCGAQVLCDAPTGACCFTDGSCTDGLTSLECSGSGGLFQGAESLCSEVVCEVFECPKGGTLENEPDCGDFESNPPNDTVNGGCNSTPNVFSPINCGETYCGSTAQGTAFRDTDWYEVVTTEDTVFTFTVTGSITMQLGYVPTVPLGGGDCSTISVLDPFATGAPFVETSITTDCLPAGQHWFFVSTGAAGTFPCPSDYIATLTCETPCEVIPICGPGNPNDCFSANTTPGCSDLECCETVCACDPFCCATAWDAFCAADGFPAGSGCGAAVLCTGAEGACCLIDGSCIDAQTPGDCDAAGGTFQGDGSTCDAVECPVICGAGNPNDCFADNETPGCSDQECCETVCACDPFCCETAWDEFCAADGFPAGSGCGAAVLCAAPACPPDCVTSATFLPPPDGKVDGADLAVLLGDWGACPGCCTDTVSSATFLPPPDGVVDGADLAVLLGAWGDPGCPDGFP